MKKINQWVSKCTLLHFCPQIAAIKLTHLYMSYIVVNKYDIQIFCFLVISSFIVADIILNKLYRKSNVFITESLISWFTY